MLCQVFEPSRVRLYASMIQDSARRTTKDEDYIDVLKGYITAMTGVDLDTCN